MSQSEPMVIPVTGVSVEVHHGRWKIKTGWPSWGRRSLDVLIHEITDIEVGGIGTFARQYRINLNSSSARSGLAQRVDAGPIRQDLQRFLDVVAENLANNLSTSRRPIFTDTTVTSEAIPWLIYPFWPGTGVTGLAAAPSSLKSFLSLAAALQISTGAEILKGNTSAGDDPGTVLYLDWEDNEQMFRRRLRAIEAGAGLEHGRSPVAYLRPMRSLVQSIEELTNTITELGPKAIIIDSMSAAIDGSMNDSDIVNEFYNAVHALGAPTLVITHKSIENQRQRRAAFMGSGMSLARVRMAWNAEKSKNGAIVWECFKDNHGSRTNQKLAWEVGFVNSGDQDEYLDAVTIEAVNPRRVQIEKASDEEKLSAREAGYQQISAELDAAGVAGMAADEVAAKIVQSVKTAQNRLSEMEAAGRLVKEKIGRKNRYWHPPHHQDLVSQRNETADSGEADELPSPY